MPIPSYFRHVHSLGFAAVFDATHIQFRFRFATGRPSWYHGYKVFRDGGWHDIEQGAAADGPVGSGLYEDRIALMFDDGKVPLFDQYGGYIFARPATRSYPDEAPESDVKQSAIGRRGLGDDVRKYIPESREGELDGGWRALKSEDALDEMRKEGRFLSTLQWRAHRSNPAGYADPGHVLEYRHSNDGDGMYADNFGDDGQPRYMFDRAKAGHHALRVDTLLAQGYGQDDAYFLHEDTACEVDGDHAWQDGDVLPTIVLRAPAGSRAALLARGRHHDGAWHVRMTRRLDGAGHADTKPFVPGTQYRIQLATHTHSTAARWHLVSMPLTLSLGEGGDIRASEVEGDLDSAEASLVDVPMHYVGIATLEQLMDGRTTVHRAFAKATEAPLDRSAVQSLLDALIAQEEG